MNIGAHPEVGISDRDFSFSSVSAGRSGKELTYRSVQHRLPVYRVSSASVLGQIVEVLRVGHSVSMLAV